MVPPFSRVLAYMSSGRTLDPKSVSLATSEAASATRGLESTEHEAPKSLIVVLHFSAGGATDFEVEARADFAIGPVRVERSVVLPLHSP